MPFHPSLGAPQFDEPKLLVKAVSILCRENPSPEALKLGMRGYNFHQPLGQPLPAEFLDYEYVGDPGQGRVISYYPSKSDLASVLVDAERQ
jgi:hypothetical protein